MAEPPEPGARPTLRDVADRLSESRQRLAQIRRGLIQVHSDLDEAATLREAPGQNKDVTPPPEQGAEGATRPTDTVGGPTTNQEVAS
jgi:hypothetical protein